MINRSRPRVYIAGPISKGNLQENVDRARDAARKLIKAGAAPLCPQLTVFMSSNTPTIDGSDPDNPKNTGFDHSVWIDVDRQWVQVSQAILRLPGESKGADAEVEHAVGCGLPVYFSLDGLIEDIRNGAHFGGPCRDD